MQVCAHLCRRSGRVHVSLEDQSSFRRQQHFSVFLKILHGNDEYFSSYSTCCTHNNSIFQASCEVGRSRSGTPLAIIDGTAAPKTSALMSGGGGAEAPAGLVEHTHNTRTVSSSRRRSKCSDNNHLIGLTRTALFKPAALLRGNIRLSGSLFTSRLLNWLH